MKNFSFILQSCPLYPSVSSLTQELLKFILKYNTLRMYFSGFIADKKYEVALKYLKKRRTSNKWQKQDSHVAAGTSISYMGCS